MKVITICGSLKFKDEMMKIAIDLALKGNCVITPIYPADDYKSKYTKEEIETLNKIHKEKIRLSDAIFVVNVNGYIGSSTKNEILYSKSLNKEIIYYN